MKLKLFLLLITSLHFLQIDAQTINPKADSLYNKLMHAARPQIKNWVYATAKKYRNKDITETVLASSNEFIALGNLSSTDIPALTFLVLMQATKDADEDLKSMTNQIKEINKQKQQQRQQINAANKMKDSLRNKKDAINDLNQQDQLQLQQLMERKSKLEEMMSKIMKTFSSTQDSVIKNLK